MGTTSGNQCSRRRVQLVNARMLAWRMKIASSGHTDNRTKCVQLRQAREMQGREIIINGSLEQVTANLAVGPVLLALRFPVVYLNPMQYTSVNTDVE